jgi:hypothetical protein
VYREWVLEKNRQGILWESVTSVLVRLSVVGLPEALSRRSAAATIFQHRAVAVVLVLTTVLTLTIWNVLEAVRSGPLCDWSVVLK